MQPAISTARQSSVVTSAPLHALGSGAGWSSNWIRRERKQCCTPSAAGRTEVHLSRDLCKMQLVIFTALLLQAEPPARHYALGLTGVGWFSSWTPRENRR